MSGGLSTHDGAGLWHDGVRVCNAEVAETRTSRRTGLLGREGIDGVLVIRPCRSVHSFRMRFALDVAGCSVGQDGVLRVRWIRLLLRNRLFLPSALANVMIEAESGSFARWGVRSGDVLEIR